MAEKVESSPLVTDGPRTPAQVQEVAEVAEKKPCCRRPYLVEPFAVIYSFGLFAFISLNSEYLYYRVDQNAAELLNQTSTGASPAFSNADLFGSLLNRNKSLSLKESVLISAQQEKQEEEYKQALQASVSARASQWSLYLAFARGIPPLFMILIILSYGDINGRKFGLLLPSIGGLLRSICYLIVEKYNYPIEYLLIGNLLEGFSGYHLTVVGAGFAYIADVVPHKSRSFRFTLYNSFVFLSAAVASLCIGLLISSVGWANSFAVLAGTYGVCILYVVFLLPETITSSADVKFSCTQVFVSTLASFKVYTRQRENPYDRALLIFTCITLTIFGVLVLGIIDLDALYLLGDPFNYGPTAIGYFLAAFGAAGVVGPLVGVKLFQCCGVSDAAMVVISCVSAAVCFAVQGTATTFAVLFSVPVLSFFAAASVPVGRSLMSKAVTPMEQGALQASVSCLTAVGELASTTTLLAIYGATVAFYPGTVFLVIAGITLLLGILYAIVACVIRKGNSYKEMDKHPME